MVIPCPTFFHQLAPLFICFGACYYVCLVPLTVSTSGEGVMLPVSPEHYSFLCGRSPYWVLDYFCPSKIALFLWHVPWFPSPIIPQDPCFHFYQLLWNIIVALCWFYFSGNGVIFDPIFILLIHSDYNTLSVSGKPQSSWILFKIFHIQCSLLSLPTSVFFVLSSY